MFLGNHDPLDKMFCIQSFDDATNTFVGSREGDPSVYLGAMWMGEPVSGFDEGSLLSLQSLLAGSFPAGSIIQFGLISSPDIGGVIDRYLFQKRDATHPLLNELVNRHAETIRAGTDTPVVRASGVHLSTKRLIVTLKCEYQKPSQTNLISFVENANKLESSLGANGLFVSRCLPGQYLGVSRLLTHMFDAPDERYNPDLSLNEQVFYSGDEVNIENDYIEFKTGQTEKSNFFMTALSPKFFPLSFSLGMMNYVIGSPRGVANQLKHPYYLTLTLYFPDQMKKRSDVDRKAAWINHQLFGGSAAKFLPSLVLKKEGFDALQQEMDTQSAVLVEATFTLYLFARKLDVLRSQAEDVRTYWSSLGFDMRQDKIILDALFSESLPLNGSAKTSVGLFRSHTLTSTQAAQFLPIIGEWRGSPNPTVMLTTRRGEIGGFDLYKTHSNMNCVLVAQSGSGKSFLTQRLITDYRAEGAKVWVVDSGRSYQKLAAGLNGTFMEFAPDSDICLNPFTSFLEERGGINKSLDDEMDVIASLLERMCSQRDPLGDLDLETLKKAIRQTFEEHQGHTTVAEISNWLNAQSNDPRAQDLALRLDSFSHGQYAKFFNSPSNVDMSNDFVVLELDDLKNQRQLQQVVLLQLISEITNEMYLTRGRKKILIIDEAWELLNDPVMARAMATAFRQARKHDGSIVVVTQGIGDLYDSPHGRSMLENAAWQIILQQKSEAINEVYESGRLTIDPYNYEMLKTLSTVKGSHSELMIMGNGACGIFRLTVDKFTQAMYSTSGAERSQVLEDLNNGVDVIESLQRLLVGRDGYSSLEEMRVLIDETLRSGVNSEEILRMVRSSVESTERLISMEAS
jgi:conjugal transfer ATP-binding protein TraC